MPSASRISNYAAVGVAQLISMYSKLRGAIVPLLPVILGITPNVGPQAGGSLVRITGYNFEGISSVTIGGAPCTSVIAGGGIITCYSPASGSSGAKDVVVIGPAGPQTLAGGFTYAASGTAPTVTGISKTLGLTRGGQSVTIAVSNSSGCTGGAIGGVALIGFAIVDGTHVSGVTGAKAASTGNTVTVTNGFGTSSPALSYEYWSPLTTATPQFWYDLGVCSTSAGKVTALPDQSGNGRNATLAGSGLAYTVSNSGYGNLPTMHRTDSTDTIASPVTGITTGARTFVFVGDAPAASFNFMMRSDTTGVDMRAQSGVFRGSDDGGATLLDSGTVTVTNPNVVVVVYNGASSRNYGNAATATTGSTGTLSNMVVDKVFIGDTSVAGGGGDINFAHALVFSGALSDAQCKELLRGFGALAAITIGP